ncbi:MAG: glucose-6-phosphate isomerase, partial [Comamonas sp.]
MVFRCHDAPEWAQLQAHFASFDGALDVQQAFAQDADRLQHLSLQAPHVFADLSKNWLVPQTEELLSRLASRCGVAEHRDAMLQGERINGSENRAVMHWLLRMPRDTGLLQQHAPVRDWPQHMHQALDDVHST